MIWQPLTTAPRDGSEVLARRHNGCFYEHIVLWWAQDADPAYPWASENNAHAIDRWDDWMPIPGVEE